MDERERANTAARPRATILVADRDTEAADALIHSTLGTSVTVVTTCSQRETLQAASRSAYNVALVNLCLSSDNGGSLIPMLQEVLPTTPIIAIGEDGDSETERFAYALGATWYLPKPLDRRHLLRVVQSTLRRPERTGSETPA